MLLVSAPLAVPLAAPRAGAMEGGAQRKRSAAAAAAEWERAAAGEARSAAALAAAGAEAQQRPRRRARTGVLAEPPCEPHEWPSLSGAGAASWAAREPHGEGMVWRSAQLGHKRALEEDLDDITDRVKRARCDEVQAEALQAQALRAQELRAQELQAQTLQAQAQTQKQAHAFAHAYPHERAQTRAQAYEEQSMAIVPASKALILGPAVQRAVGHPRTPRLFIGDGLYERVPDHLALVPYVMPQPGARLRTWTEDESDPSLWSGPIAATRTDACEIVELDDDLDVSM
jgi:hypothetical protein